MTEHDDLTARLGEHRKGYASTSDEVWERSPICLSCGHMWPCEPAEAADLIDSLEADLERARFHYVTERDMRNGRLVEQVERLYRERDELAATVERLRARLRKPRQVWVNGNAMTIMDPDDVYRDMHEAADLIDLLTRKRDELAATVERVRAIHQPVHEEAEVWADGPGEDLHDQFVCSDDPSACLGHLTTIKVCRECGYEHDGEQPIFRGWPCPTIKALGADTEEVGDRG